MNKGKSYTNIIKCTDYNILHFDIIVPFDLKLMTEEEKKVILLFLYNNNYINDNSNEIFFMIDDIRNGITVNIEKLEKVFYQRILFNSRLHGTILYNITNNEFTVWEKYFLIKKLPYKSKVAINL